MISFSVTATHLTTPLHRSLGNLAEVPWLCNLSPRSSNLSGHYSAYPSEGMVPQGLEGGWVLDRTESSFHVGCHSSSNQGPPKLK